MPKIPNCDRCCLCAPHPDGPDGDTCLYFESDPNLKGRRFIDFLGLQHQVETELWEPEGASFYNGQLILQPLRRRTQEKQLELLDNHPMFTGICPACGAEFERDYRALVHWDCPCGWKDDTI